jgi:hypothetical protein
VTRRSSLLALAAGLLLIAAISLAVVARTSSSNPFASVRYGEAPSQVLSTMGAPCRAGAVHDPFTGRTDQFALWKGPANYELAVFARRWSNPPGEGPQQWFVVYRQLRGHRGPLDSQPITLKYRLPYSNALTNVCTHRGSIGIFDGNVWLASF